MSENAVAAIQRRLGRQLRRQRRVEETATTEPVTAAAPGGLPLVRASRSDHDDESHDGRRPYQRRRLEGAPLTMTTTTTTTLQDATAAAADRRGEPSDGDAVQLLAAAAAAAAATPPDPPAALSSPPPQPPLDTAGTTTTTPPPPPLHPPHPPPRTRQKRKRKPEPNRPDPHLDVPRPVARADGDANSGLWAVSEADWAQMSARERRRAWHVARIMSGGAVGVRAAAPCEQCAAASRSRRKGGDAGSEGGGGGGAGGGSVRTAKARKLEECWVYRERWKDSEQCAGCRYSRKGCSFVRERRRELRLDGEEAAAAGNVDGRSDGGGETDDEGGEESRNDDGRDSDTVTRARGERQDQRLSDGGLCELERELAQTRADVALLAQHVAEIRRALELE